MTDPRQISITDYSYALPEDRVAKYPLPERDASKLLIYDKGNISGSIYKQIADQLPPGALLVFNKTRVIEARLIFKKQTGGVVEIFCLEPGPGYPDITNAMRKQGKVTWKCLVGGASKWKAGQVLEKRLEHFPITLRARYVEKTADAFLIELSWTPSELSFAELLHHAGAVPLPPYIKRQAEESDADRYQTIYAREKGSVAAPTAGLHFTPYIMSQLDRKKIVKDFVTLHVGAGTFKPVKAEFLRDHEMHAEWIEVNKETIQKIRDHLPQKVIAVGTTSLRTIESLHWLGAKIIARGITDETPVLDQWEAYDPALQDISTESSFDAILNLLEKRKLDRFMTRTGILIAPGYRFKIINGLITNFHQPQSTLLLLIAAFIGNDWKKVYAFALENDFRFLSYGDGCLLWR